MSDKPKPEFGGIRFTFTPIIDHSQKMFGCVTADFNREISRRVACAEDEAIKRSLKALGWMPPEDVVAMREALKDSDAALRKCLNYMLRLPMSGSDAECEAMDDAHHALRKLQPLLQ